MTPTDFPQIKRDACVTDATIAYAIVQAKEYAALHAPNAPSIQAAIIRLFVIYCFEHDMGEKNLLRIGIDLLIGPGARYAT